MQDLSKRKKWSHDSLPLNFPTSCSEKQLQEVIQDLYEEFCTKTKAGKDNVFWERIINLTIDSARTEMQHRNSKRVLNITTLGVLVSLLAVFVSLNI